MCSQVFRRSWARRSLPMRLAGSIAPRASHLPWLLRMRPFDVCLLEGVRVVKASDVGRSSIEPHTHNKVCGVEQHSEARLCVA